MPEAVTKKSKKRKSAAADDAQPASKQKTEPLPLTDGAAIAADTPAQPVLVPYLAPIARPLADDKLRKKVLKLTKKATKRKQVKRGVKEVIKALRKSAEGCAAWPCRSESASGQRLSGCCCTQAVRDSGRHLAHRRDHTPARLLRGPGRALHLRALQGGAACTRSAQLCCSQAHV